jgi:hypothetical protein
VLVGGKALTQEERVVEENLLAVNVLDNDPEGLGVAMNVVVPHEIRA